ncbi:hypothetical protein [Neisseria bergeri]|uniref:hypothetical protein n=2 Tax=Neisseria bergeri TaxID=1906581 RepID=UPI0027DF06A9|nr:hypothetical protein [Neisseria bergeri]
MMLKTLTFAALHFSTAFSITYSELPTASALLPSCTCVLRRRAQSEPNRNRAAG